MITGYFMCTSKITLRKFVKLMGQVYFYRWLFFVIFVVAGYEEVTMMKMVKLLMPVWNFQTNFVSCFIGFWLTIPFLNILVQNMTKRQHECLLLLSLGMYTILGSVPGFNVNMNYLTWFGLVYLCAAYIRLYPNKLFEKRRLWGWMTLLCVSLASISIIVMQIRYGKYYSMPGYYLMSDSNRFFAVAVAVCSFLWFKNIDIKYSKVINAFGAGTFGVLLIHAASDAMRQWLWVDTLDVVGHYALPFGSLVLYSFAAVLGIFIVCNLIDQLRIATLEKSFLKWYDQKVAVKAAHYIERITIK